MRKQAEERLLRDADVHRQQHERQGEGGEGEARDERGDGREHGGDVVVVVERDEARDGEGDGVEEGLVVEGCGEEVVVADALDGGGDEDLAEVRALVEPARRAVGCGGIFGFGEGGGRGARVGGPDEGAGAEGEVVEGVPVWDWPGDLGRRGGVSDREGLWGGEGGGDKAVVCAGEEGGLEGGEEAEVGGGRVPLGEGD